MWSGSGLGAERAQYNDDGIETPSFEPSAVHMASHDGATHLTIDDAVCETPSTPDPMTARTLREACGVPCRATSTHRSS